MDNFVRILLRAAYLITVLTFAFGTALVIALASGGGVGVALLLLITAYLFTFLPALTIAFLPERIVLEKPPLILKIWYGWIVLLGAGIAAFWVYDFVHSSYKQHKRNWDTSRICFHHQGYDEKPYVYHASKKIGFDEVRGLRDRDRWCGSYATTMSPFKILATTSSTTREQLNNSIEKALTINLGKNQTHCIFFEKGNPNEEFWISSQRPCP